MIEMRHLYRPQIVHVDRKGHKWLGFQVRSNVINHLGSPCIFFWLFILCLTLRLSRNEIEPFFKRALASIQEEFWATKNGQKLLRGRVERSFAEFVARVPAPALLDSGLKRHCKQPES